MFTGLLKWLKGNKKQQEFLTIKGALNGSSSAIMMVDRDFIVTYVNDASKKLFNEAGDDFRQAFPMFDPSNIVGTCVDIFHRNPAHQRQLLADPSRLPFDTDIKVGSLTISLHVTASCDARGRHVGNVLEWCNVTKEGQMEMQNNDYAGQIKAIGESQGVIEFGLDGKVIEANKTMLNLLEYTEAEVVGQHHSAFVEPAYHNTNEYRAFWDKLNRGQHEAGQYKFVTKSGRQLWLQASYNPILDMKGEPFKVVKYATDITQEMKARRDALRLRAAINNASTAIMMVNRDFIVTYVNDTTKSMLEKHAENFRKIWPNFNPAKIVGSCVDMFHKNPAHQRKLLADPKNLPWKTEISVGDLKFALNVSASFDLLGNYDGNILEWADVTEARAQEILNKDYSGQLAAINSNQPVIEFTPDGKVIRANDHFLRVMGYSESEASGQHHSMFVSAAYKASPEYRAFWEKLNRGEFDAGQYKRIAKGGREVWLQASYNPILDINGKVVKIVKFASDVTAAVQASQALVKAVAETRSVIASAKAGDLTHRIGLDDKSGDIADLCGGINSLIENMAEIITQIKEAGDTINTAANEIAAGNNDLSQRTEEQASSLEETASSMEELASTVKQNAENAKQANQLAAAASGVAVKGGRVVGQVVHTMNDISDSSGKIVEIISVIDGIAFQTNILALNAAVEAARAGEQGRGFAVVAGEVRNLAQRSAAAAKEIKQLISDSVEKVQGGTKLVEEAGRTMDEIVSSVKRVTDIMGEIAAASAEQSSGIALVNTAITNMDEVTQQNAALVEQAAAAAESLVEQANGLRESISVFRVNGSAAAFDRNGPAATNKVITPIAKAQSRRIAKAAKAPVLKAIKAATADGDWEEF